MVIRGSLYSGRINLIILIITVVIDLGGIGLVRYHRRDAGQTDSYYLRFALQACAEGLSSTASDVSHQSAIFKSKRYL